jgi:hypothetical protein
MEFEHALEGKVSGDIGIHDKKWLAIIAFLDEVSGERKWTGSVHRSRLVRERQFDSKSISVVPELLLQHVGHVADSENDVFDASSNKSFNLVKHHRLVAKVNKWLWAVQGQWPEPSSKTSDKNNCLHI